MKDANFLEDSIATVEPGTPSLPAIDSLPPSVTLGWINLIGLLSFFAVLYWLHLSPNHTLVDQTVFALLAACGPIIMLEVLILKVHRRNSTGIHWQNSGGMDISRSLTKFWGWPAHWRESRSAIGPFQSITAAFMRLSGNFLSDTAVALCYWPFPISFSSMPECANHATLTGMLAA